MMIDTIANTARRESIIIIVPINPSRRSIYFTESPSNLLNHSLQVCLLMFKLKVLYYLHGRGRSIYHLVLCILYKIYWYIDLLYRIYFKSIHSLVF